MAYQPGPYPAMHLYLQWGGALPGAEQWSCGLRMRSTGAVSSLDPVGMLTAVRTAVSAYHTNANVGISPRAVLQFAKLNAVGTDGRYIEQSTTEYVFPNVAGGGQEANTPPNQVALAVTLTTGFSRGPAHRGRFYLPLPTFAIGADGRISANDAQFVGTATDTFIAALNAASPNWKVGVFSRKLNAPASRQVDGNVVGRVLDTQRRRRRNLVEDYK